MGRQIEEARIESALLSAAEDAAAVPVGRISEGATQDSERLKKRLSRLNDLYISGFIDRSDYEAERKKLMSAKKPTVPPEPVSTVSDYRLGDPSREEKKAFWSRTLERLEISAQEEIQAFFYQHSGTHPSGTATTITVRASMNARRST